MITSRTPAGHALTRRIAGLLLVSLFAASCQTAAPAPAAAPAAPTRPPTATVPPAPTVRPTIEQQPIPNGPVLLRAGISLRQVLNVGAGNIRLARNPVDGAVYLLNPAEGLTRVTLTEPASLSKVMAVTDIFTDGTPSGMRFGPDGTLYMVANRAVGRYRTQALIRKGTASGGAFTWTTLAATEPYPLSATPFDHLFNGIVVSPDGQWVYVNSGSRTDHGEIESNSGSFPDTRDVALTARIFRLPAKAVDLVLPNDEAALTALGVVFARGTRNSYDPAFAPNGDLFAGDNGPDADYPDELNWLREGKHYGFPWRFGVQDNPQQFPDYDHLADKHLQYDFTAVKTGTYQKDPSFPKPPGPFTDPVINLGPAAAQYRADDGSQRDAAAEGKPLNTFTPHRSPLGLVFASDPKMPVDLRGTDARLSAFIVSWGAAGGTLTDRGQDLLHMWLTRSGDNYTMTTEQFARGFDHPIDALLIENRLYVLEFGANGMLWELTFN